jgi:hypothetical protein
MLHVKFDEVTCDKNFEHYDRIASVYQHVTNNGRVQTWRSTPYPLAEELKKNYDSDFKHVTLAVALLNSKAIASKQNNLSMQQCSHIQSQTLFMKNLLLSFCMLLTTATVFAQSAKEKAETLAAQFSKKKDKEKEKNGVKTETHVNILAKPDIRENESAYTGKYTLDGMDQYFSLTRSTNNSWEGKFLTARSDRPVENGRLKNIRIESGLITAVLEYPNGSTVPFEGVFITRTGNGTVTHALGISQKLEFPDGTRFDKVVYRKTEK